MFQAAQQVRDVVVSRMAASPHSRSKGARVIGVRTWKPCKPVSPESYSLLAWLLWVGRGRVEERTPGRKALILRSGSQKFASCKKEMLGCKLWRVS